MNKIIIAAAMIYAAATALPNMGLERDSIVSEQEFVTPEFVTQTEVLTQTEGTEVLCESECECKECKEACDRSTGGTQMKCDECYGEKCGPCVKCQLEKQDTACDDPAWKEKLVNKDCCEEKTKSDVSICIYNSGPTAAERIGKMSANEKKSMCIQQAIPERVPKLTLPPPPPFAKRCECRTKSRNDIWKCTNPSAPKNFCKTGTSKSTCGKRKGKNNQFPCLWQDNSSEKKSWEQQVSNQEMRAKRDEMYAKRNIPREEVKCKAYRKNERDKKYENKFAETQEIKTKDEWASKNVSKNKRTCGLNNCEKELREKIAAATRSSPKWYEARTKYSELPWIKNNEKYKKKNELRYTNNQRKAAENLKKYEELEVELKARAKKKRERAAKTPNPQALAYIGKIKAERGEKEKKKEGKPQNAAQEKSTKNFQQGEDAELNEKLIEKDNEIKKKTQEKEKAAQEKRAKKDPCYRQEPTGCRNALKEERVQKAEDKGDANYIASMQQSYEFCNAGCLLGLW